MKVDPDSCVNPLTYTKTLLKKADLLLVIYSCTLTKNYRTPKSSFFNKNLVNVHEINTGSISAFFYKVFVYVNG